MLCGRILLFLAKLLPLTERSGVNLHGNFNTSNTTTVEEAEEASGGQGACVGVGVLGALPLIEACWVRGDEIGSEGVGCAVACGSDVHQTPS